MRITDPYNFYAHLIRPWPVVGIDILQDTLVRACAQINSKVVVVHPADIGVAVGACQPRSSAPTGRCWNCQHVRTVKDPCEPSILHLPEWQMEWGDAWACPYWHQA